MTISCLWLMPVVAMQLSFTFPRRFHLARNLDNPLLLPAQRDALPRVLVLAEQTLHQGQGPIVIGSTPTISIDLLTGPRAELIRCFCARNFAKRSASASCMNCRRIADPFAPIAIRNPQLRADESRQIPLSPDRIRRRIFTVAFTLR